MNFLQNGFWHSILEAFGRPKWLPKSLVDDCRASKRFRAGLHSQAAVPGRSAGGRKPQKKTREASKS